MKLKLLSIFLVIFFVSNSSLQAQNDTIDENDAFFDDGGISKKKNLIKINTLSLLSGDLPVSYERGFGKRLSLEVGVGVLLPFYFNEIPGEAIDNGFGLKKRDLGYSLTIFPKYYLFSETLDYVYVGFQYRQRNFDRNTQSIRQNDYCLIYGFQYYIYSQFSVDFSIGIGFRFTNSIGTIYEESDIGVLMPFALKFGYLF